MRRAADRCAAHVSIVAATLHAHRRHYERASNVTRIEPHSINNKSLKMDDTLFIGEQEISTYVEVSTSMNPGHNASFSWPPPPDNYTSPKATRTHAETNTQNEHCHLPSESETPLKRADRQDEASNKISHKYKTSGELAMAIKNGEVFAFNGKNGKEFIRPNDFVMRKGRLTFKSTKQHGDGKQAELPQRRTNHLDPDDPRFKDFHVEKVTKVKQSINGISITAVTDLIEVLIEHFDIWKIKGGVGATHVYFTRMNGEQANSYILMRTNPSMAPFIKAIKRGYYKNLEDRNLANNEGRRANKKK